MQHYIGMIVGKKLSELRKMEGWTQDYLADKLQISRSTLANYERSARQVPNELIPKIAKLFGVRTDYLFGLED